MRKSDRVMARKILRAIHDTVVEAGAEGVPESIIFMSFSSQGVPRRDVQKFVNALVSGGRLQRRNNVLYASDASMAAAEGLYSSQGGRDQTIRGLARQVMRHMRELNEQYEEGIRPRPATFDRAWDELSRSRVFLASDQGLKETVRRVVEDDIRVEEYEDQRRASRTRRNPSSRSYAFSRPYPLERRRRAVSNPGYVVIPKEGPAPGFSVKEEDGEFRLFYNGRYTGKYAMTKKRAEALSHKINPETGKKYKPWDRDR